MKKGDKQFDVGYGQGGGGGMGGAYKGPTGGGAAYGRVPKSSVTFRRLGGVDKASPSFQSDVKDAAKDTIKESVKIGAGAGMGVAGVVAKNRKDAEKMEAYRRKPRMADAPPKIKPRKAYED